MTAENSARCISRTINKYEGTTLDLDPRDRGNWDSGVIGKGTIKGTKFGIAAFVYPNVDIANLTLDGAVAIYRRDYWPKVCGDALPVGIDLTAWDCCVNSGASRALKFLGRALDPPLDPAVGPAKLAQSATVSPDKVTLIKKANAMRRSFLIGLHNATYEKGWLRRVADVEATSISWFLATVTTPEVTKSVLAKEAGAADVSKSNNDKAATATGTAATATGTATGIGPTWDIWMMAEVGLTIAIIGFAAYYVYKRFVESNRADAFREAAANVGA